MDQGPSPRRARSTVASGDDLNVATKSTVSIANSNLAELSRHNDGTDDGRTYRHRQQTWADNNT